MIIIMESRFKIITVATFVALLIGENEVDG
jgi:hypothetical protein